MRFLYQNTCFIPENKIKAQAEKLTSGVQNSYLDPKNSIDLKQILQLKKEKVSDKLRYLLVLGVGGSNLGAKAVYDALYGYFDLLEPRRFPKIIFLDTNDTLSLAKLQNFLKKEITSPDQILINIISKSGATLETLTNLKILEPNLAQLKNRLVITSLSGSNLTQTAQKQKISFLPVPGNISGRFSVFSSVGLFPLAAANINLNQLLNGAKSTTQTSLSKNTLHNPAALSAVIAYLNLQNRKSIHNYFFFHPELESLGKWCRQLTAESLGKNGQGITPLVSIGSTDLHSMVQLYLDGPKDKFTVFISGRHLADNNQTLAAKTVKALYQSTLKAYQKQKLPFVQLILDDISSRSLGQFMQFKMIETLYLGKLLNLNPFNQPAVELYKKQARQLLKTISKPAPGVK